MFFKKRRKGQIQTDLILFIIFLLILGIVAFFGNMVFSDINEGIQNDTDLSPQARQASNTVYEGYAPLFDNMFVTFLMFFWIIMIVSSFMIDTHPLFFIISVVLLIFILLLGMVLANVFQDVSSDPDVSSSAANFPKTTWVFDHFLIVLIIIGFTVAISLYAKLA